MFKLLRSCADARCAIQKIVNTNNLAMSSVILNKPVLSGLQLPVNCGIKTYSKDQTNPANAAPQIVQSGRISVIVRALRLVSFTAALVTVNRREQISIFLSSIGGPVTTVCLYSLTVIGAIVIPIIVFTTTKNYVHQILYNPATDEYTAMTMDLFMSQLKTTFKIEDVYMPDEQGILTVIHVFEGKQKKILAFHHKDFTSIRHYKRIIGLDRKYEFKIDDNDKAK